MNKWNDPHYTLDELLSKYKYKSSSTINSLVKENINYYDMAVENVKAAVEWEVGLGFTQNAGDKVLLQKLKDEISEIEYSFINKIDPPNGLLSWPEITIPFQRLGFDIARENASTPLAEIISTIYEKEMLFPLFGIKGVFINLQILDYNYYNDKGFKDVSAQEILFEMIEYVIQGAATALFYKYLLNEIEKIIQKKSNSVEAEIPPQLIAINNNFDHVDINTVYLHFKKGLVEKKHLSEDDLLFFIRAAFDKKTPPVKRFVINAQKSREKIHKVFHSYYNGPANKPLGKQKEYAALLGEYFEGFNTNTVSSNFS